MKKLIYFSLVVSFFSFKMAVAQEPNANQEQLIPAQSLEEMLNAGVDETSNEGETAIFDFHRDRHHGFVCFARNRRGYRFEARGEFVHEAQRRVMHECLRVSRQCFELGCRRN